MKFCFRNLFSIILSKYLIKIIPDKLYLMYAYRKNFGYSLNLKNPKTFSEKLQWLKLYNRKDIYTKMVDKYEVRSYVASIIGEDYLIPLLGVWNKAEDIDFTKLPDTFVLKTTHDSGGIIICKNKEDLDVERTIAFLTKRLNNNVFDHNREWPYKNVVPKIIAEMYISDRESESLNDYKFFCFNGKVKCFKIDYGRFTEHHANYYTPNGELLPFGETVYPPLYNHKEEMPDNLSEMLKIAEILSENHPFLRVDLYNVQGKIYFGELTFFPNSGMRTFTSKEWDLKLGEWINLQNIQK